MKLFESSVLLVLCAVAISLAEESRTPPEDNCRVIENNFGICNSDRNPGDETWSRDEADRVHKLVEKTMEGNAELYKGLSDAEPASEGSDPDVTDPSRQTPSDALELAVQGVRLRGKRQVGEVSNCGEKCYTYKPYWIYYNGRWVRVIQTWFFTQSVRWCWCTNKICSGKTSQSKWWYGKCRKERSWRKLLVWYRFFLRWIWVKVDNGCCCVPWNYA